MFLPSTSRGRWTPTSSGSSATGSSRRSGRQPFTRPIRKGVLGRIAVAYVEWSGPTEQKVVVPWTVIDGPAGAARLRGAPRQHPHRTGVLDLDLGAIDFGVKLLAESGVEPLRRVIDISGDGPNNSGRMVTLARNEAVAQGITINGLPFMLKRPTGIGDIEDLDLYYQDCVIGGPGAFIVPVRERRQFAEAIRTKLVREIAGVAGPRAACQARAGPGALQLPCRRDAAAATVGALKSGPVRCAHHIALVSYQHARAL